MDHDTQFDRSCAALIGMAIGDALGMPSQTLTRQEIQQHYGTITEFTAPFDDHPVSHGLEAAQVTDDTEQSLLLARRLIADHGQIVETAWARDLLDWEADIRARGLRDLLGPSSKAALDKILAGAPPSETGKHGTTNGAAMRIAPIGIANPVSPQEAFLDQVEMACRMTHNTGEAIAAAAAVATTISGGISGQCFEDTLEHAVAAAKTGQQRGYHEGAPDMADRLSRALSLAEAGLPAEKFADEVGTSVHSRHSIPAAFGIVRLANGDPWQATVIAANIGDDTDTIGAIAGAMAGACSGLKSFPPEQVRTIRAANDLPVEDIVRGLLNLRHIRAQAALENPEVVT
ncbi:MULTISPECIES: ADP-ribosylglycohydrolase family protein [unclassified Roseovarius]|uniref:ADP-ribosylglycohydrolase family protein n=1 Tax=unclassified Roseovarius TaxID=2614913 RepID=UPI00273E20B4|nr:MULTISPECIES: ADP-ribosylglycohydrolase family protein [unclassified Roseovarius]